jgi:hypothetical protein
MPLPSLSPQVNSVATVMRWPLHKYLQRHMAGGIGETPRDGDRAYGEIWELT